MSSPAVATVLNPLTDTTPIPRLSFHKFAGQVRKYVTDFGKSDLVLTWQPATGAPAECIDADELGAPRTGIYRCRLAADPSAFIEAAHTSTADQEPRDPRRSIDMGWQHLTDQLQVSLARYTAALAQMEERWLGEHRARLDCEENLARAEKRIKELELELSRDHDEPIFDSEMMGMLRGLWDEWQGFAQLRAEAETILDQCSTFENEQEVYTPLGTTLLKGAPHVIHLLAKLAGQGPDGAGT